MSEETPPAKDLLLDEFDEKLAAFQAFRKSDSAAADDLLSSLGAQDDVDRDIVLELASKYPWGTPIVSRRHMPWRCVPWRCSTATAPAPSR